MSGITQEKLAQMGISKEKAMKMGLVPKSMEEREQRMKADADYAKYLNTIQTDPQYLAKRAADVSKYNASEAQRLEERRRKYDPTFWEDFSDSWNDGVDWIQENVQPITKYVPVLGQAVDVAVGLTDAAGSIMEGASTEEILKKVGKGVAKTADVFVPGAEKIYNVAENTIEAAITGDLDKIKNAATGIASAAIGSDAGKKALEKVKGEAEKRATDFISNIKL